MRFGASHCRPYHARIRSRACDSEILSGSSDSGRNASLTCSYGTSAVEPQKSQRWPILSGSKTEIAWQLWQRTEIFAACQPRAESGMLRSAAARSCSTMTVSAPRVCERGRRLGAAERTDQRLLGRIPVAPRRRTPDSGTSRARWRPDRVGPGCWRARSRQARRLLEEIGERAFGDAPLRADASCPSDRRPRGSRSRRPRTRRAPSPHRPGRSFPGCPTAAPPAPRAAAGVVCAMMPPG